MSPRLRWLGLLFWMLPGIARAQPESAVPLEFHRVHVPGDRIGEVSLGTVRYVPMPLAEFDAAVARVEAERRAGVVARPVPLADAARYDARLDDRGMLTGTLVLTVDADSVAIVPALPLGEVPARCTLGHVTGPGGAEALVFATADGRFALRVPEPGEYTTTFTCRPVVEGASRYRLPLVPALSSSIRLQLSPELRPVLSSAAARHAVVRRPDGDDVSWQFDLGPVTDALVSIRPAERGVVGLSLWTEHVLRGNESVVEATVEPTMAWTRNAVELEHNPGLLVTGVEVAGTGEPLETRHVVPGQITIMVPTWLEGRTTPLRVRGLAPAAGASRRLPLVRAPPQRWAGGGMRVIVDPALAVKSLTADESRVVAPQAAARWPIPTRLATVPAGDGGAMPGEAPAAPTGTDARRPAIFHVEQQGPAAAVTIDVEARRPQIEVARVTTVEISSGAVLGRAACDLRVLDGEAFDFVARITPGWIIDAVDIVEWPAVGTGDGVAGRPASSGDAAVDWRITSLGSGSERQLRIGLAVGVTASRELGLRISGHRPGIPVGAAFTTADVDMVRFAGESADAAVLDFKTGPDTVVEIAGDAVGWFPAEGRLARLVEDGTLRGRIRAGDQSPTRPARVVRRRPPLEARVEARIDVREDVLLETFSFACRAEAGGIDTLLVHFSEPMDDDLEWSVVAPPGVVVSARRLDPADARRPGGSLQGIAESWLVECSPPVTGLARIRAARSVPFSGPVPVVLAWVESARQPRGTLVVASNGAGRPVVVNRRLRELPANPLDGPPAARALEFAYGAPTVDEAGTPAAELAPADAVDGRAWAWGERVRCWCHESGATECESTFEIENHGRGEVVLAVPSGRIVEGIAVDGVAVPTDAVGPRGGTLRIPLPPSRRRVELFVRTLDRADPRRDVWRVQPLGCTIDVPVLDRRVDFLLPPGLVVGPAVAGYRPADAESPDWLERLLAARPRALASVPRSEPAMAFPESHAGFREARFVVTAGRIGTSGVIVMSRRLLLAAAVLAALMASVATLTTAVARPRAAAAICLCLALVTLWVPSPFILVARTALWSAVGGLVMARASRSPSVRSGLLAALGVALMADSASAQPVEPPVSDASATITAPAREARASDPGNSARVFITSTARDVMALVPEPLFRLLADASAAGGSARVVGCTVLVPEGGDSAPWRVVVDVDSDAGATLVLDQIVDGAAWLPPREAGLPAGVRMRVEGRRIRVTTAVAGRHRVVLEVMPAVRREGDTITAVAGIPVASVSTLRLVDALDSPMRAAPGSVVCERAVLGGPFLAAPEASAGLGEASFDVSGATQVRLVRPVDPGSRFATRVQVVSGVNDLTWEPDSCGVEATFDLESGGDIMRSLVVLVDERLVDLSGVSGSVAVELHRLGAGRWLARFPEPLRGRATVRLRARMPLADPVGIFDVPTIVPESTPTDRPTVRLTTTPDLDAVLDIPSTSAASVGESTTRQPQRVTVRRRPQVPRGVQTLTIEFAADRIALSLRGQIEATATALAQLTLQVPSDCVIDRLRIADEEASAAVDLVWSRPADDRVSAIVQQPRTGRFRLEVDARIPGAPPAEGLLPLLRAAVAGGAPLLVTWRAEPPLRLLVPATSAAEARAERAGSLEITELEPPVPYRIRPVREGGRREAPSTTDDAAAEPTVATGFDGDHIEAAEVFMAFDGHGRARGLLRFDVTASQTLLRLALPAGARPYDVLIDGVEAIAVPRDADVWEVLLHDVGWPRSVLVLFARDFGAAMAGGDPLTISPPKLLGLPPVDIVWTLLPPPGCTLRVSGPSLRVDQTAVLELEEARRVALSARFDEALGRLGPGSHERLESLARLRRDGRALPLENSWQTAIGWRSDDPEQEVRVVENGAAELTLRVVRRRDATVTGRVIATGAFLTIFGIASLVWFLRPTRWFGSGVAALLPLVTGVAGIAWATALVPSWPGWLLVAGSLTVAVGRATGGPRGAPSPVVGAGDSTAWLPDGRG